MPLGEAAGALIRRLLSDPRRYSKTTLRKRKPYVHKRKHRGSCQGFSRGVKPGTRVENTRIHSWTRPQECVPHKCIHICIYACAYTSAHTCMHTCTRAHTPTRIHMHNNTYTYVYICIYIYIYICMYMYICTCIHIHIYTHVYMYLHIYLHIVFTCGLLFELISISMCMFVFT